MALDITSTTYQITRALEVLQQAVTKLGPERSQSALEAYGPGGDHSWRGCVIARAYGEAGKFAHDASIWTMGKLGHIGADYIGFAEVALGLTNDESIALVRAFDGYYGAAFYLDGRQALASMLATEASKATMMKPASLTVEEPFNQVFAHITGPTTVVSFTAPALPTWLSPTKL